VELVFKDGVSYDPQLLVVAVEGTIGQFDIGRVLRLRATQVGIVLALLLVGRRIWRRRSR
jgi:hypothetical protein